MARIKPDAATREASLLAIEEADRVGLRPDRVTASVDGGICIYFFGGELLEGGAHRKFAMYESLNDGTVSVLLRDRLEPDPTLFEVDGPGDLTDAFSAARRFLQCTACAAGTMTA